ncbi:hypothetical protein GCM10009815_36440 [Nocardioides marmoribigeumensis]
MLQCEELRPVTDDEKGSEQVSRESRSSERHAWAYSLRKLCDPFQTRRVSKV